MRECRSIPVLAFAFSLLACAVLGRSSIAGEDALVLPAGRADPGVEDVGDAAVWASATTSHLVLHRTPPLYATDPADDGFRPEATVALLRRGDDLWVRLRWEDRTESAPRPPLRRPDGGETAIYKQHSRDLERFADAACLMLPRHQGPTDHYPPLMMGAKEEEVTLYLWHEQRGFEVLTAHGRASTAPGEGTLEGRARRTEDGWEVLYRLPAPLANTPIAFAIWDGDRQQRDGLKYFSPWYEVGP